MIYGQFNDSYPPIMDGVANVVVNYSKYLNNSDSKCYVITTTHPDSNTDEGECIKRFKSIKIAANSPYRLGMPAVDFKFMKEIRNIDFDLIHTHNPFVSGRLGLKIAREKNIPLISTFHSKYYDDIKNIIKVDNISKKITKKLIEYYYNVDYVWTVNEATKETLKKYGYKGSIEIVGNGTDFVSNNKEKNIDRINNLYNISSDTTVLLYVGQINHKKNLEFIINSISILKNKYNNFKLLMIGNGPDINQLKKLVVKNNLQNHVLFTGLIKDRKILETLYSRAYLFLFPSKYDTCGIVLREAASKQLPSLVLENTNVSSDIIDGKNGFISKNSLEAYSQNIYSIIQNPNLRDFAGKGAKDTLHRLWPEIIEDVELRYKDIVRSHKRFKKTI